MKSKILIAPIKNILSHWIIESEIDDTDKTSTSYVYSIERIVDLTITCMVILIQGYRCSLENEFIELTRQKNI